MLILLGNTAPMASALGFADATPAPQPAEGSTQGPAAATGPAEAVTATIFQIPDVDDLIAEVLPTVTKTWGMAHSTQAPAWVASDNAAAAQMLAAQFGCEIADMDAAMSLYNSINDQAVQAAATASETPNPLATSDPIVANAALGSAAPGA